eukprot:11820370-Ditylum_brightwellii.AAC.1
MEKRYPLLSSHTPFGTSLIPRFKVEAQYFMAHFIAFCDVLVRKLANLEHSLTVFCISGRVHHTICNNVPMPVQYLLCSTLPSRVPSPLHSTEPNSAGVDGVKPCSSNWNSLV